MDKEKYQKVELFHQPRLTFLDALTGPDILNPTHQAVQTTIKLKRDSVERMAKSAQSGSPITLSFSDQFGVDMEIPIMNVEIIETTNPNVLTVTITGLFPIKQIYRINPEIESDYSDNY